MKPNKTQRSWDNYTGPRPIKAWADKGFYKEAGAEDQNDWTITPETGALVHKYEGDVLGENERAVERMIAQQRKRRGRNIRLRDAYESLSRVEMV
jgi:hypothetical protein